MQDGPPSTFAGDTSVGATQNLNPLDIERILADFRAWLEAVALRAVKRSSSR